MCVTPKNVPKINTEINWGPMAHLKSKDKLGYNFSNQSLVINVRSQMSSLGKNYDTLFERTVAEAQNLHMRYPDIVLGEVYLIPVREYDNVSAGARQVAFSDKTTDIENYISFFCSINARTYDTGENAELVNTRSAYKYERCALLIVDFNGEHPKLYNNSEELRRDGLISEDFALEYADVSFARFAGDIKAIYASRFDVNNLLLEQA